MKTILVLNMGMKSIRSIIFDSEGNKLASYAVPIETSLTAFPWILSRKRPRLFAMAGHNLHCQRSLLHSNRSSVIRQLRSS